MADIRDLKKRIKGVQNTQKITQGMKTMSVIRLQRAQQRAGGAKPYTAAIQDIVSYLPSDNGFFEENKVGTHLYVVFTSDRGLCGAFNDNLIRKTEAVLAKDKNKDYKLILIGPKRQPSLIASFLR